MAAAIAAHGSRGPSGFAVGSVSFGSVSADDARIPAGVASPEWHNVTSRTDANTGTAIVDRMPPPVRSGHQTSALDVFYT